MHEEKPPSDLTQQVADLHGPAVPPRVAWAIMILLGVGIWLCDVWLDLRPDEIPAWGWRLLAIFVPTILGLMIRPLPGAVIVLLSLIMTLLCNALPPPPDDLMGRDIKSWPYEQALGGYIKDYVWLVLAAYFMARALIKTGLARRIALVFVRALGHNTLGLSYALVGTDTLLAAMIPSNAARVGGVLLPITRSLAELYRSHPGKSAALLGSFLMLTLYQGDVVACALFLTGQASNPLAASQAADLSGGVVQLHYANWLLYALAPALASLLIVPWLIYRMYPPELKKTPEAVEMARKELAALGRLNYGEWVMTLVFVGVCLSWIVTGFLFGGKYTTLIALSGAGILFLSNVLTWEDALSERGAWDVFIWYGGLVQLGALLNEAQVTRVLAESLGDGLKFLLGEYVYGLAVLFLVMLLIYFYAHYAFASITAHMVSMYPAFVGVLLALGAPPWLVMTCFAYFTNMAAGLTHYGTTPAPIIFSTGYVSQGRWWRVGFLLSLVNIGIWLTVGLLWWKLWGLW